MSEENVKHLIQKEEGWRRNALAARAEQRENDMARSGEQIIEDFLNQPVSTEPFQDGVMTKREMTEYAEKIRDAVLLQHPAGKEDVGRLEAFIMAGRMLFGYKFGC
ncbi:MAG: hypothetical protein WC091_02000 [Sulfuricellaceae bacterium]